MDKPKETLGDLLNEAGMQVTFTSWKAELEACEAKHGVFLIERDDLQKDRDHWKQKAMELEADLKTIRNYESSTLGLANKEIENLRAENQELKEALEKIRGSK